MSRPHRILPAVACALGIAGATAGAAAQSDNDLRRENQRLQTLVDDLELELAAARKTIADLQQRLANLSGAGGGAATSPDAPTVPEEVSVDESVHDASPRALFKALQDSYVNQMQGLSLGDPHGAPAARRERLAYVRAVEQWAKRVNRELKSQIDWRVRIAGASERQGGQFGVMVVAVDPKTEAVLGDPFPVIMSKSIAHHLTVLQDRGQLEDLLLRGVMTPQVWVDATRTEPGPFDNPRIIGPFAVFAVSVTASTMTAPDEEADAEAED